jgi:hypothetical protein
MTETKKPLHGGATANNLIKPQLLGHTTQQGSY